MRKLLLAGVALGAVSAFVGPAFADDAPAAVFPVTSETDLAGYNGPSLNGAAPGSVQVNLGGRTFSALYFQNSFQKGTPSWAQSPQPQFMSYFFLYPGFDYASPGGVHFGAQAEIRVTSSPQGGGSGGNANSPVPWYHQAFTYVSSAQYGKVQFGLASGALVANSVGTSDDFGTGVFFSWYNTGMPWVMADAVDNDVTNQKVVYTTPTFGGFLAAVSFQPQSVSMNYADNLTMGQAPGANGLLSRNRVEIAGKYAGTFGGLGVKADLGYVVSSTESAGGVQVAQGVSYGNAGVQLMYAGLELEGSVSSGKFNVNYADNGNPDGPLPLGAKGTTAFVIGAGYGAGPYKFGAVYYNVSYDDADYGGPLGKTGHTNAVGLGASYTVGPGVVAYLDATTGTIDTTGYGANGPGTGAFGRQHPQGLGIGTFFTW
jgi:predicted porin